ncbi:MAG: sigma-54-dependent transcriptional regulator [Anaerotignum sp.]
MQQRIFIIDKEPNICDTLCTALTLLEFNAQFSRDENDIINELHKFNPHTIICDIVSQKQKNQELLRSIKQEFPNTVLIAISASGRIEDVVDAMRLGADDYMLKPFTIEALTEKIAELHDVKKSKKIDSSSKNEVKKDTPPASGYGLIGKSVAINSILNISEKIKDLGVTVLITGESGTGKGVIAHYIHQAGNRSKLPFVYINCGAIPETLIESELFGHEKGSFTGAVSMKQGKFEQAGEGTVFLDEIGTLPLNLQTKLLGVLQDYYVIRIGGSTQIPIKARVIAATNENLEEAITRGTFREDLFYRLNVINIECPALRFRKDDIPLLGKYFFSESQGKLGKPEPFLVTDDFWQALQRYAWPGNIRELENLIKRVAILCEHSPITAEDLPAQFRQIGGLEQPALSLSVQEQEIRTILVALEMNNGHREKTAQQLGISRRTLQYKIKKYNLSLF